MIRIAVGGKGGTGKSVLSGTLCRALARRGERVLALDSDLMPGLAYSLGADEPAEPPLMAAAEKNDKGRWRLRKGIGPARGISRFSTDAPDGVRLLQCGKLPPDGDVSAINAAVNAYYQVIHRLDEVKSLRSWSVVCDLPAGPRQAAFDWAPFAQRYLVVAEATWQSALTARRVARVAEANGAEVILVASKVAAPDDVERVAAMVKRPVAFSVPLDRAVAAAERKGIAPIDAAPDSPTVAAIERLADALMDATLGDVKRA